MEPTIAEIVCAFVLAIVGWGVIAMAHLPWNEQYNPKGDDPYRYCPKEEY